ncbi:hypothetical protein GXW82_06510 [Streptacidiphilus sp. 4-A2]|nr:hypothetical protein [Streptacidiphilus sp. 4-A2]
MLSFAMMLVVLFVALWFAIHPSVESKATELAQTSGNQPVTAPVGVNLPMSPSVPSTVPQPGGGNPSTGNGGSPSSPAGNPGNGQGSSGKGSGSGTTSSGGQANSPQQPQPVSVSLPIMPNNPPNLLVEAAQYRLSTVGSSNPCHLGSGPGQLGGIQLGVIDSATETSLVCYQKATDARRHGNLTQDEPGELGRQTLTSLWSFGLLGKSPSDLNQGNTSWSVYQANAALGWATNTQISQQLLTSEIGYAQTYINYIAGQADGGAQAPTMNASGSFNNTLQNYISQVSNGDSGFNVMNSGLGAGLVESPQTTGSGSVPAGLWPPAVLTTPVVTGPRRECRRGGARKSTAPPRATG